MLDIQIRPATLQDLVSLLEFEQGVLAEERPFDPTLRDDTVYYDLEAMIKANHIELVVAETDNKVVGCGFARIEHSPPYLTHDCYAYLAYMFVIPDYRRLGVNAAIIESLKQWSRAQGLLELRLKVYTDNIGAIDAYKKAGFKKLAVEMRMNLDEE